MSNAAVLSDLARVRALFQARAIAAVIGAPLPTKLPATPETTPNKDRSNG